MTTFKEIRGTTIEVVSSDPSNPEIGQIWYNSSSGTLKGYISVGGAWASGGNLNTAVSFTMSTGTQNAALQFGGGQSPLTITQLYNGTSWTTSPATLSTGRYSGAGIGTQTSSLLGGGAIGGTEQSATEEYDGISWTAGGSLNNARKYMSGCGSQTAGLIGGGGYAPPKRIATEAYNGTSWTSLASLNTGRYGIGFATGSPSTAALAMGGTSGPNANTESWNGSSWTSVNSLNTARGNAGGAGTQTAALFYGGATTATESWNGTSWTNVASLATARSGPGNGNGSQTAALAVGGNSPAPVALASTEEWTDPSFATRTITVS
jgi:hypothetical protein